MTIVSVAGKRRFRINPENNCIVQLQENHKARWKDYRKAASWTEASKLVLKLAMGPTDETEEVEAVKE